MKSKFIMHGARQPVEGMAIELISAMALRHPDEPSATQGDVELGFSELMARAQRMASALEAQGVRRGDRVAVNLPRDIDLLPAILGVLWIGAAFAPIPFDYPAAFRDPLIDDLDPVVVIALAQQETDYARPIVPGDAWKRAEPLTREAVSDEQSPAYVLYTSGTTGRPKGVVVTHAGLANYLHFAASTYFTAPGGAPLATSIGFDFSLTSLLAPLAAGQAVHFLPEGEGFLGLLHGTRKFSVVKATPSHLVLAQQGGVFERLCCMTHAFVLGGEQLSGSLIARMLAVQPGLRIYNEYGPTETVVGSTMHEVTAEDARAKNVSIGRPIWNTDCLVVGDDDLATACGEIGQLLIGGAGVSPGYWRRPDLTSECFRDRCGSWHVRHYKTGDLVRRLPGGDLEFIGRRDPQMKINGVRVELEGLRWVILEHPDVAEAIVTPAGETGTQLKVHVALAAGVSLTADELAAWLRSRVPVWMIPHAIAIVREIPLTAGGKFDMQALQATHVAAAAVGQSVLETVRNIWLHILKRAEIDDDQNFLDAGGTSLEAILATQEINKLLGLSLLPTVMFEYPTVATLSRFIESEGEVDGRQRMAIDRRTKARSELRDRLAQQLREWR